MIILCHKIRKLNHKMNPTDNQKIAAADSGADKVTKVTSTAKKGECKKMQKKNIIIPRMQIKNLIELVFPGRQFLKQRKPSPNWFSIKVELLTSQTS